MPLLESDLQDGIGTMDLDSQDQQGRPRSSSGSSGLKGLISGKSRQRNKSGDDPNKNGSPTTSKMKSFFDTFRPRSKSDVSGLKKPSKKAAVGVAGMDSSMDESQLQGTFAAHMKLPTDPMSPMGQILEGQMMGMGGDVQQERMRHKSAGVGGSFLPPKDNSFMSKFRARSNSDSRTRGTVTGRKQLVSQVNTLTSFCTLKTAETFWHGFQVLRVYVRERAREILISVFVYIFCSRKI